MSVIELLDRRSDAFRQRTLVSSGIALLIAAASRLPAWEVSSPVTWLIGTVNVGFLPIFGPLLVLGTFCFTYLAARELRDLQSAAAAGTLGLAPDEEHLLVLLEAAVLGAKTGSRTKRFALTVARFFERLWCFGIPVLAYLILLASYFDFVRPKDPLDVDRDESARITWRFPERGDQRLDLLLGTGGWGGFRPLTPSIKDALLERARVAKDDQAVRLRQVARTIPWIYPPLQTWAYLAGLFVLTFLAAEAWREYQPPLRARISGGRRGR